MKIKKGDLVTVVHGDEKGKTGRILKVVPEKNRIIIEKVGLVKRHLRPNSQFPQGGIREIESSVNASNVMIVCPKCGQSTRIINKIMSKNEKSRICKKCKEVLDERK